MPDMNVNHQRPPRSVTSTRWSKKWATLGGCSGSTSTTMLSNDKSDRCDRSSKTDVTQHRQSTSLYRKSSTISRADDLLSTADDNKSVSMKKSSSLMNVLRSKLNSPTILRRFRSKSRENSKTILADTPNQSRTEHTDKCQSRTKTSISLPKSSSNHDDNRAETNLNRQSRKRDPSPMRRFAQRFTQLTRHSVNSVNESKTEEKFSKCYS
jgi:hypothetical protein